LIARGRSPALPLPMDQNLSTSVQYVRGVGPRRASLLSRLGISTIRDALFHLPFRYEDRRTSAPMAELRIEETTSICGKILSAAVLSPSSRNPRLRLLEVVVTDGRGFLKAKWFNQTYLKRLFKPGQEVILYGVVKPDFRSRDRLFSGAQSFEMINPEYELIDDSDDEGLQLHTGRVVPVYRTTEGLSQRQIRSIMYRIVDDACRDLRDPIPRRVIGDLAFPSLAESLHNVHFPSDRFTPTEFGRGASPFHQRLAFDELFTLELGLAVLKRGETRKKGIAFAPDGSLASRLLSRLPFRLTAAQERVFAMILADMRSPYPMNRLIQGDVGSGKTVVALLCMLSAVECGYQAALMAPTEILAEQHFITIHRLVEDLGLAVRILTGDRRHRDRGALSSGEAHIAIGTHALIQEGVSFRNLGLIVIDEQHRFGVMQRALLRKKGANPDILIMTATPIPRTLALTLYGDLDYSMIDELPPGRTPVSTELVPESRKALVFSAISQEVGGGGQVYVVYPVIEGSEKQDLRDAVTGKERLQERYPDLNVGLIHGRMKAREREEVMAEFTQGRIHILVSTTVIEVGVDVPNAALMVIIHAERFGLSQLHQLRGRVGRGERRSRCLLLSYGASEEARRRLDVMVATTDGFRIAEEDLAIRGPGEFFGTRQSGLPDLRVSNLLRDARLLETARQRAFALVEEDPCLENHPLLRRSLEEFWGRKIELFKTA